jgi:CHAT domain-containing protein
VACSARSAAGPIDWEKCFRRKERRRRRELVLNELTRVISVRLPQRLSAAATGRFAWSCLAVGFATFSSAHAAGTWDQLLDDGVRARSSGTISESVAMLEQAVDSAPDQAARVRARTQLGLSLIQAGRLNDADKTLESAYEESSNPARVGIGLALGNVAAAEHDAQRASGYYREVLAATADGSPERDAKIAAQLNLARLQTAREKLATLEDLYPRVEAVEDVFHRARAFFSLGEQASQAIETARIASPANSDRILRLAYRSLSNAADLAQASGDDALRVEAADALAQLYESEGHFRDALRLNRTALALADTMKPVQVRALLVKLEWRAGRLNSRIGDDSQALASYLRAARHLEVIRQDLPIEDEAGRSTYQTLVKPIFVSLVDLMLKDIDGLAADEQHARLAAVLDAVELTHQAEMQDYLGDRCSVDSVRERINAPLDAGVAVIYTVVLKDRLEVIVRSREGIWHHAAPVSAAALNVEITTFRSQLVDTSSTDYLATAQQLYGWLIEPFETQLTASGVRELVIVPDGYLRLIPFAALHDARQFMAERYVISTVTGLTMTETTPHRDARAMSLLAGLAEPGPVVDRLAAMGFTGSLAGGARALPAPVPDQESDSTRAARLAANESALRSALALPGVKAEIQELVPLGRSVALMNGDFTVARFQREVGSGRYRVIHIASHGFFGDSAQESFLLAFDNVIRIDDLQKLIADNGAQTGAIDLLTLSACDTATGDDRAPLGFAGAAIKAKARSVVGTLWAVSDNAAQQFMEVFYSDLAQRGKAEALAQAQRSLIQSPRFSHPYYWAPMLLIGDWN